MKRCPKCKDNKVVIFDSDNDWCPKCERWFPAVAEEEDKCEVGCKHYHGGEIKHHKDCYFYPESISKMYDDLKAENKIFKEALNNMYFAYANKDEEFPHSFEIKAVNESEELLKIRNKLKDNLKQYRKDS